MNDRALVPQQQQGLINLGATDLDATDFVAPRVKVLQQMSQEVAAEGATAKAGEYFNVLTGENYGQKLTFIPILAFKQRLFIARMEKQTEYEGWAKEHGLALDLEGIKSLACRSLDMHQGVGNPGIECAECPMKEWRPGQKPPYCSEVFNVAAVNDLGELIILSFQRASTKIGKQMFSMIRMGGGAAWTKTYEASTTRVQNDLGIFYVPAVRRVGPTPPDLMSVCLTWAHQLQGVGPLDVTPAEDDTEGDAAGEPEAPF